MATSFYTVYHTVLLLMFDLIYKYSFATAHLYFSLFHYLGRILLFYPLG